jgi:hypothetical protein
MQLWLFERIQVSSFSFAPSFPLCLHLSPEPISIPPPTLNGEKLYEREDACQVLLNALCNLSGARVTPFCDNCFGAGKTSLIWKFRNQIPDWSWPQGSESLRDAVYVHVRFTNSLPSHQTALMDFEDSNHLDQILIPILVDVFSRSLKCYDMKPETFQDLVRVVTQRSGGFKFLIHMDDVGRYEHSSFGKNILYRMWHCGEAFRSAGHYYVLTGRSTHLHTIGRSQPTTNPVGCYDSPNVGQLIPLPLLSPNAIKSILVDHKKALSPLLFNEHGEPKQDIVDHIHAFSGGVPRAITNALLCYLEYKGASFSDVEAYVVSQCQGSTLKTQDRELFCSCLELGWAQISFSNDDTICDEEITAVIARLGIFRDYHRDENGNQLPTFSLMIPPYLMRIYNCTLDRSCPLHSLYREIV